MEKQDELQLLRMRSMAAVISDGYRLYTGAFRRLFRSSWATALVYALAFALLMGNLVNNVVPLLTTISSFGYDTAMSSLEDVTLTKWLTAGSVVLFCLAALALASHAVTLFREHQHTGQVNSPAHWYGRFSTTSFVRLLATALWLLLTVLVAGAIYGGAVYGLVSMSAVREMWASVATIVLLVILAIIIMAVLLPLTYTMMRPLLAEKLSWRPPFKGYGQGFSHWGMLFAVLFVVAIFTTLLTLICELPAVIITIANVQAYAGLAMGDPLGMPDYVKPMTYGVFFLAGFIQAFVHLSSLFPFYYAYGTIEQQQQERLKMN